MLKDFMKMGFGIFVFLLSLPLWTSPTYSGNDAFYGYKEQATIVSQNEQNKEANIVDQIARPDQPMEIDPSYYQENENKVNHIQIVLVPRFQSTLSSQITAKINNIFFKEGDAFKKDDMLVQFDCEVNKANRNKAKAEYNAAEKQLKINQRLTELASLSKSELGKSEAEVEKAAAELDRINAIITFCEIRAPFDGRVSELIVNNHETVSQGNEIIKVIDDTSLQIEMFVPSSWLIWLKKESTFHVKIDETGVEYPAKVVSMGALIDSVSQSLKIVGELDGQFPELIAGMGGQAYFVVPESTQP